MADEEFFNDVSFSDIKDRVEALSARDKERAMRRLSQLYQTPQGNGLVQEATANTTTIVVDKLFEQKLPRFSGSPKLGSGEVSIQKWYRAASRLLDDPAITDNVKKSLIFKSLLGLAEDIADLHSDRSPKDIVELLKVQFGGLRDGEDLLIEFHQHIQQPNESAADFLSSLFVELGEVQNNGGIDVSDMEKTLLKQFIRGSSDEELLTKLRLDDKLNDPPSFPEFICLVRKEENRRIEKRLRAKKLARSQQVNPSADSELEQLRKELAEMKVQLASTAALKEATVQAQQTRRVSNRHFYCFRCGEDDDHMAYDCTNPPNKKLVEQKFAQKRQNQGN